jgi:alcohol dehydrogenase class IV
VLDWVLELRSTLNIPHTLAEVGFTEAHCELLARDSVKDPTAGSNPILLTEQDYVELFRKAWSGDLS